MEGEEGRFENCPFAGLDGACAIIEIEGQIAHFSDGSSVWKTKNFWKR